MRLYLLYFLLVVSFASQAQMDDSTKTKKQLGISLSGNYSFSGISSIANLELILKNHIIYAGPKIMMSRTYLPLQGPWGANLGYKYEYNKSAYKRIRFFFNADYQVTVSNAYSTIAESSKNNYVHELFVGYGVLYKFNEHIYLGNALAIGLHYDVFNNVDLNWRQQYYGYNNLFRVFLSYRI